MCNISKILVVDDLQDDLQVIKQILENAGYKVYCIDDPKKALVKVKTDGFDLVLIDVLMPGMTGPELMKKIKSDTRSKAKLVLTSVLSKYEVPLEGADGFIQKPFSVEELLDGVTAHIPKPRVHH